MATPISEKNTSELLQLYEACSKNKRVETNGQKVEKKKEERQKLLRQHWN